MAIILNSGTIETITDTTQEVLHIPNNYRNPDFPAFCARRDAGSIAGTTGRVVWNNVLFDNGGNYDNTTGLFTAPIDGIYWFECWTMDNLSTTQYLNDYFRIVRNANYGAVNGDEQRAYTSSETADRRNRSAGTMFDMSAGDTAEVYNQNAHIFATSTLYNRFLGYLVQL